MQAPESAADTSPKPDRTANARLNGPLFPRRTPPGAARSATPFAGAQAWRTIGLVAAVVMLTASTIAVTLIAVRAARDDAATAQERNLDQAASALTSTLRATLLRADDAAAFLGAGRADAADWRIAQGRLFADPALFGAGEALAFPDGQRPAMERQLGMRLQEPGPGGTLRPAGRRASYVVPIYVAYRGGGRAGRGVDLAAEPRRLATLRRAALLGRGQLTAPVPLLGTTNQFIVIAYVPIHVGRRRGGPADVTGYVIASYRTSGLVAHARAMLGRSVRFRLTDGQTAYQDSAAGLAHPQSRTLRIAGRALHLAVGRPEASYGGAVAIAAGGVVITILVALLLLRAMRGEERALADRAALQASEQRLIARTAELERANRELETFAYSVSHDLRAPVRAVDGFSKAVIEDHGEALGPEGRRQLERVRAAAVRMGRLVDDILKLSRLSRQRFAPVPVDVSALAREIDGELRAGMPGRVVRVDIQDGLLADADPDLVRVVLRNLLSNAYKFTSKTAEAHIRFGAEQQDGIPVYSVADNGAGFDMAHAQQLFLPFHRLHRNSEFPGEGIGLATVTRAVRRHGGVIWARGAVDQGATFWFTLTPGAHPPPGTATGEDVVPAWPPTEDAR